MSSVTRTQSQQLNPAASVLAVGTLAPSGEGNKTGGQGKDDYDGAINNKSDDGLTVEVPAAVAALIKKESAKREKATQLTAFTASKNATGRGKNALKVKDFVFEFIQDSRVPDSVVTDKSHSEIQARISGIPTIPNVYVAIDTIGNLIQNTPSKGGISWDSLSSFGRRTHLFFRDYASDSARKDWNAMEHEAPLPSNNRKDEMVSSYRANLKENVVKVLNGDRLLLNSFVICCCLDENHGGIAKTLRKQATVKDEGVSSSISGSHDYCSAKNGTIVKNEMNLLSKSLESAKKGDDAPQVEIGKSFKKLDLLTEGWEVAPLIALCVHIKEVIGNWRYKDESLHTLDPIVAVNSDYRDDFKKLVGRIGSSLIEMPECVVISSKNGSRKKSRKA